MKTSTKFLLTAAFIGTLGLGGLAKVVYASQREPAVAIMPQSQSKTQIAEAYNYEIADDADDRQEAAQLRSLAKITPQQAQQAAQAAVRGTVRRVELDEEDGNLIYTVTIAQTEVAVDAGNGKVLYTENINQEDNDATEARRPRSSIQVPRN
ncbi:MAG: PepSY domain-containing protein [Coleofasciculaceae cyanobacterium]